jgi:hypothetical protein
MTSGAAVWEVIPGREENRKAGYITHNKNYHYGKCKSLRNLFVTFQFNSHAQ